MFTCFYISVLIILKSASNIHPCADVYGKACQLIFFHVQLLEVIGAGENAIRDPVTHVVLHVQGCDVDKLGRAARRIR